MEVRMAMQLAALGSGRYRLIQNAEINVTPFVDVMLVLLIIFMVAIPVATTSLNLDIPKAQPSPVTTPPTIVTVQADGRLFIGETPTSLAGLPTDLARVLGSANPKAQRVYLRAERTVRYRAFMEVTNRLKGAGFSQLGLVSEDLS
jgi:biopolymer transport protein ExbD